jgi:probable F420-dependent oxidoreductase
MQVGISERFGGAGHDLAHVATIARAIEEAGFDSFWAPEHLAVLGDGGGRFDEGSDAVSLADSPSFPDPFVTLTAVAAATRSIIVGTAVTLMPLHSPFSIARAGATLDVLSGGRFVLGAGVGWEPREYAALGVGWTDRGRRATEHLEAVLALWSGRPARYAGSLVHFEDVIGDPHPLSRPHPPVLVGGGSDAALRRAAQLGDGWFGWGHTGAALDQALGQLDGLLTDAGRSREDFTLQVGTRFDGDAGRLSEFAEYARDRAVDRIVVTCGPERSVTLRDLQAIAAACRMPSG